MMPCKFEISNDDSQQQILQVGDPQLLNLAKKLYGQLSGREEKEVNIDYKNLFSFQKFATPGVTVCV